MTMRMTSGMMIPAWGFAPGTFRGRSPARYTIIESDEDHLEEMAVPLDLPPNVTVMQLRAEPREIGARAAGLRDSHVNPYPTSPAERAP